MSDCFELYEAPSILDGANAWYCPECKTHVDASQTLQLWSVPEVTQPPHTNPRPLNTYDTLTETTWLWLAHMLTLKQVLVIQLKRFAFANQLQAVYKYNMGNKIKSRVDFPLENLDVAPYLVPRAGDIPDGTCYDLTAVCNHHGTMRQGHYTAFARGCDQRWYEFDDDRVTPVHPNR